MRPIQLHETFGDLSRFERQLGPVVRPKLDREVGQRNKQCKLVGGCKVALSEEALQFRQKRKLLFG